MLGRLTAPEQDHLVSAMRAIETMIASDGRRTKAERKSPPPAPAGRSRLGGRPARRALCPGIWLGRKLRGPVRADRCRLRQQYDPTATAAGLPKWTARMSARYFWSRIPRRSPASPAVGRSGRARTRPWHAPDGGMRSLRPRARLSAHYALDAQVLTAARHVYERAGFRLTSSEPRRSFGQNVISEHWDLAL